MKAPFTLQRTETPMPNYYTHLTFGRRVLRRLPALLRTCLVREEDAFLAGCLGPDPLFFYRPFTPSRPRAAGVAFHHAPFRAPAEALLSMTEEDVPFAGSYAAGFLCHFALDSLCHPLVEEAVAGGLSHSAVESELDRSFMIAHGLDPLTQTPLPGFDLPPAFFSTAASLFPGVSPEVFSEALSSFCRVCRLQTRAAGTRIWKAMDRLGTRFPPLSALRGSVLTPRPDPACAAAVELLMCQVEKAVHPTAQALVDFFSAAAGHGELGSWYDRDFYGRPAPRLVMA